jgi:hypothetical protein
MIPNILPHLTHVGGTAMPAALQHTSSFSFGHHIRPILVGMDLLKLHQLGTHHLSNPMIPHLNMLGSSMETMILGKIDSTLDITI